MCIRDRDYDYQYVFVSLAFIRSLVESPDAVSGIEIKLSPGADAEKVKEKILALIKTPVNVKNKDEQNAA